MRRDASIEKHEIRKLNSLGRSTFDLALLGLPSLPCRLSRVRYSPRGRTSMSILVGVFFRSTFVVFGSLVRAYTSVVSREGTRLAARGGRSRRGRPPGRQSCLCPTRREENHVLIAVRPYDSTTIHVLQTAVAQISCSSHVPRPPRRARPVQSSWRVSTAMSARARVDTPN